MVVTGNPPYSRSSQNDSPWIEDKIKRDYITGLGERKHNLGDDYVKFIKLAEDYIERNGTGIVGIITNHSFIEGHSHRIMRKHLLETFDKIYIIDLCDGSIFGIKVGVAISIMIRTNKNKDSSTLGELYYASLSGSSDDKFDKLNLNNFSFEKVDVKFPEYFYYPFEFEELKIEYDKGFGINEVFTLYNSGVEASGDTFCYSYTLKELALIGNDLNTLSVEKIASRYNINQWKAEISKIDIVNNSGYELNVMYRPFDFRYTYYTGNTSGFLNRPRSKLVKHFLNRCNVGLAFGRGKITSFISSYPTDSHVATDRDYQAPLFLYNTDTPTSNLNTAILSKFEVILGKKFDMLKSTEETFNSFDILDYIYHVLHNKGYYEKYKELITDFVRIKYPDSLEQFNTCVKLGKRLRKAHLVKLGKSYPNTLKVEYSISGNDKVEKVKAIGNKVYINDKQYFDNVPPATLSYYIGDHAPGIKWLKDRRGRVLTMDDIKYYIEIINRINDAIVAESEINSIDLFQS